MKLYFTTNMADTDCIKHNNSILLGINRRERQLPRQN